jgi:hypothetical protein
MHTTLVKDVIGHRQAAISDDRQGMVLDSPIPPSLLLTCQGGLVLAAFDVERAA